MAKKTKDETTSESAEMPAKDSSKKMMSKKPMVLGVLGLVGVVAAVALGMFLFNMVSSGGDEGIDIPDDFETFENDDFKFGYPNEGWTAEDSFGTVNVKEESSDEGIFGATTQASFSVEAVEEGDEDKLTNLKDQNCTELENDIKDEISSGDESFEVTITSEKASINDLDGCKFEVTADYLGLKLNVVMYTLANPNSDEEVFQVGVTQIGEERAENYDDYLKVVRTFQAK
jgi:hypothetical protein